MKPEKLPGETPGACFSEGAIAQTVLQCLHGPIRFLFQGPGQALRGNIGQKHELEKLLQPLSEEDKALNQSQVMSRLCLPLCDALPTMILPLAVGRRAKCPPSTEVYHMHANHS